MNQSRKECFWGERRETELGDGNLTKLRNLALSEFSFLFFNYSREAHTSCSELE